MLIFLIGTKAKFIETGTVGAPPIDRLHEPARPEAEATEAGRRHGLDGTRLRPICRGKAMG